ncbi:hypothetical protein PC9H_009326 [Pleurotus ostreatus]|uniref:Uncharacterized protein n=1 Tax=Pleurotus ostreatus TaxID=5322 RepID=A0A8H6ZR58_PLEOS|nr:uncharacterized protein PC9H_009326 [Pleurotus ostreatus]KAF7424026.1 hypothetical protein PC9H_009326 [Pleurotus ostreatus]
MLPSSSSPAKTLTELLYHQGTTYQVPGPPLPAGNAIGDTNYPGVSDNNVQQAQEAFTPLDGESNVGQTDNSDAQRPPGDNLLSGPDLDGYQDMPLQQYISDYIYEDTLKCWLNDLAQICNTRKDSFVVTADLSK